jgi:hypothetical protein
MLYLRRIVFRDRLGTVQRQHHPDVSVHQRAAIFRRHHKRFGRRLPFGALLFRLRQRHDVGGCILQGFDCLTLRRSDGIVEAAGP